ncbi:uncharacterized protein LOC131593714 [Vicia villosa]|uniref:uncharacterized protein LOC131593714 n=1 Tax=Vicia villosa TaxID=3911 RepID=UPI00273CF0BA|nr:uncharacterized protein LOC131593714 [Vicia villosa]
MAAKALYNLPVDCWELIISFLIFDDNNTQDNLIHYVKSLSLVSKTFLSIISRLILTITIFDPTPSVLRRLFHRFSNLNSVNISFHHLDAAIALALRDTPTLKSLSISNFDPDEENCIFSHFIDSLLSLKCLTCLDLLGLQVSDDFLYSIATEGFPLKKFVLRSCTGYSYDGIYFFLSKCSGIQHLGFHRIDFLNDHYIAQLSLFLGDLVSIKLCDCWNLTKLALFALIRHIRHCHSLSEITMEGIGIESVESFYSIKDFDVNPQLKSLCLTYNSSVKDENILMFASIFPNLQHLDLSSCNSISEKSICQVLSRCCKIKYLNLSDCREVWLLKINSVIPELEVLNLSNTSIDDKTLFEISTTCCGLLHISLRCCKHVTEKGVTNVIENFTQLKEIDLRFCHKVDAEVILKLVDRDNYSTIFLF